MIAHVSSDFASVRVFFFFCFCRDRYVLVSLLVHGKLAPLPKYTPTLVQRHLKAFCGAYKELSNSFGTRSVADMGEVRRFPIRLCVLRARGLVWE